MTEKKGTTEKEGVLTMGARADYEEFVDFISLVFHHDMEALLPKLYKEEYGGVERHYMVKEEGKLVATVGSYPMTYRIGAEAFKAAGIGAVSVHSRVRRKGYMRLLMDKAMEDMRQSGVDFACLGGQRQRYAYWGFDSASAELHFFVDGANLKHAFAKEPFDPSGYALRRVERSDADLLRAMELLHDAEPVRVDRAGKFYDTLLTWFNKPVALLKGGALVGYAVLNGEENTVVELIAEAGEEKSGVIRALHALLGRNELTYKLPPFHPFVPLLESIAEGASVHAGQNVAILRFERLVRAALSFKAERESLADGEATVSLGGEGLLLRVKDNAVTVSPVDGASCSVSLSAVEATRLLFGPLGSVSPVGRALPPAVRSWFPLPLHCPSCDNV